MKVTAIKPNPESQRAVINAVIYGKLPEEATRWDVLEVINTTVTRGSGESIQWHPFTTVRLNGKQVFRDKTGYIGDHNDPLKPYGDKLVPVGKHRHTTVYVIRP